MTVLLEHVDFQDIVDVSVEDGDVYATAVTEEGEKAYIEFTIESVGFPDIQERIMKISGGDTVSFDCPKMTGDRMDVKGFEGDDNNRVVLESDEGDVRFVLDPNPSSGSTPTATLFERDNNGTFQHIGEGYIYQLDVI